MKSSTRAALLSGLAFPGTGQIYLKRLWRGITIMVCVLCGIVAIVWVAAVRALAILEQLERQSGRIDMETLTSLARTTSADAFSHVDLIGLFVVCCWLFSIVDACRIGKKMECPKNNQEV